jgi:drug/metabolite transporter (DMT)-like permease
MFGQGLYAYDTYFQATINKGTDIATLFIAVPLLIAALILSRKQGVRQRFFLTGVLSYFLYYSASIAFGIAYNMLFLAYLFLFSASLFAFVFSFAGIISENLTDKISPNMPRRGIAVFLIFAGMSVFVWLFDIIGSLMSGKPPQGIAIYTTQPTYFLDLGIIAPTAFASSALLFRKKESGYPLAAVLLTLNSLIGIVVLAQTAVQEQSGIMLAAGQLIAYVGIFAIMSGFAIVLNYRLLKNLFN